MTSPEPPAPYCAPQCSVVVLCFRAGEAIREYVCRLSTALEQAGIQDYQIVLVGNYLPGSNDPTPLVVGELAASNPRIACTAVVKQGMMGWDMRSGLALATGDSIAVIDGDGQMPVWDVVRAYQELDRGGFDLVKTYRIQRGDGSLRWLISLVFNGLFHLLFPGLGVRDVNSKPKILTRAAYRCLDLRSDDWFIDAEIMIQARRLHFQIGEIETRFLGLTGRRSFVSLKTVAEFIANLMRYRLHEFRQRRD